MLNYKSFFFAYYDADFEVQPANIRMGGTFPVYQIFPNCITRLSIVRFILSTAYQFLSFEKELLTNFEMYAILTTETKSTHCVRCSNLLVPLGESLENDHTFDHLPIRTTRKQCKQKYTKASFLD